MITRKSKHEQRAWNRMRAAIGSGIWTGADLVKASIFGFVFATILFWATDAMSSPKEHRFYSPSFNGQNQSSHYLTIENQESNRKAAIKEEIQKLQEELERDARSTTLAKFIRNVESRIYSTLSRQIVEQMFGENPSDEGAFNIDGTGIQYVKTGDNVELTVTDENGSTTVIDIPIGDFGI